MTAAKPFPRRSTNAPAPPPVWLLVCEFAYGPGNCICARTEKGPCKAVAVAALRIENSAQFDLSQKYDLRRKRGA